MELYHDADYCDNCTDEGYKERPDYEPDRDTPLTAFCKELQRHLYKDPYTKSVNRHIDRVRRGHHEIH